MKDIFGKIDNYIVILNKNGQLLKNTIDNLNIENIKISFYQIMPNHLHIIFEFEKDISKTLSSVVSLFKSRCTYFVGIKDFWQRGYYERVVRDENEYNRIVKYINENPYRDKYNW